MNAEQKTVIADQIWLNYYNSYLYDRGLITETQRNKMKNLIASGRHGPWKKKHAHRFD